MGDSEELAGSWLWYGKTLDIVTIWEGNQRMKDCLPLSICNSAFHISKFLLRKKKKKQSSYFVMEHYVALFIAEKDGSWAVFSEKHKRF